MNSTDTLIQALSASSKFTITIEHGEHEFHVELARYSRLDGESTTIAGGNGPTTEDALVDLIQDLVCNRHHQLRKSNQSVATKAVVADPPPQPEARISYDEYRRRFLSRIEQCCGDLPLSTRNYLYETLETMDRDAFSNHPEDDVDRWAVLHMQKRTPCPQPNADADPAPSSAAPQSAGSGGNSSHSIPTAPRTKTATRPTPTTFGMDHFQKP